MRVAAQPTTSAPLPLRPVLPDVRIIRRLGLGGMGAVFLAADDVTGQIVALKVLAGRRDDDTARRRFQREIEAISVLRHPHIVALVRAGELDGAPYALLERVRGHGLHRIGTQSWPVVVHLGRQLADGLAAIHAAGWLHRDIKRSNAMVSDHGWVTLIDFGLASPMGDAARDEPSGSSGGTLTSVTAAGAVVGTPRYLAPERKRGGAATAAADVYALGVVLHELLGGVVDREGRVRALDVRVPDALAELLAASVSGDPAQRPSAPAAVATLDALPTRPYSPWEV